MIKTAVILAGGAGLRLMPLTEDRPKTLVEVGGKPLLYWILIWLKKYGIERVVIGVSYKKEKIFEYIKNNDFGLKVDFSEHTIDGETGEGFRLAIERFVKDDDFLALNSDQITNLDLSKMIEFHYNEKAIVTMAVAPLQSPFSIVNIDADSFVTSFDYKPLLRDKLVSNGIYVFNKKIIPFLPQKGSIETLTFTELANIRQVKSYVMSSSEWWTTVNDLKDLINAEKIIKAYDLN